MMFAATLPILVAGGSVDRAGGEVKSLCGGEMVPYLKLQCAGGEPAHWIVTADDIAADDWREVG